MELIYFINEFVEGYLKLLNSTKPTNQEERRKANIQDEKANIQDGKANIDKKLGTLTNKLSRITINYIYALHSQYLKEKYFTRADVESLTGLKATRAYELIKLLLAANIIEPVKGQGKGKHHFMNN